ncbi:GNAT family N-acetyltransferase [Streptomyces pinistramenti]|uniref:GNAT family N-acetyltransferase n=1 Tax=Streptomyces pinistramenti TaxID=2884812 RepID=UPI001D072ABC|nr:GNAT family N-acetyltransferase [Streptomyces pinistramenti]MCB5907786.1 GNAT family N-acetyltransferase [Streptomyces pinistramenti]
MHRPVETATPPHPAGQLTVGAASLDEWREIAEWAAQEEWNPGLGDTECFHPTDPAGFFTGRLGTRTVSAVSVVNYSADFAFLGYYLVHPDHRGTGLGLATWRAAVPHAGRRTIGLDAVPAQQATYARAGFTAVHDTLRYAGRPEAPAALDPDAVPFTAAHLDAVAAYDRRCFPAGRHGFLSRWLTAPGHHTRVLLRAGRVAGYGVTRPARSGHRIGPLFADTPEDAAALFDSLTAAAGPGGEVFLDIPEPRQAAQALATGRGLTACSHTVRMYTGPVPPVEEELTFGVTSLELG